MFIPDATPVPINKKNIPKINVFFKILL